MIIAKLVSVVMTAASLYIFHPLLCLIVLIAPVPTLYTTYIGNFISKKHEAAQFFELIDLNEQPMSYADSRTADGRIAGGKVSGVKSRNDKDAGDTAAVSGIESMETRNMSYRYPLTDEFRIKNVNFKIRKGEKVAFVGENGAGKTTFVKLLTGMLQPTGGELLINGKNAKEFGFRSRYNSMSCVFQDPARFNTFTIADNVCLGDVERERDEAGIDSALAFAGFEGADRDAMLGKDIGGTELSGGQWQKIAIARAYYRSRDFYILDEPTSNLDPLAEAEVFKKYIAMTEGKTVIMVTHRISVASLADMIVVFRDGEIVEDGTHDELLSRNGEYARLYSIQAQWYDR